MKKLLYILVLSLLTLSPCYAQQGVRSHRFTIAGPDSAINLLNTAIAWHEITWNVSGTASACTVALDTSTNGTTWSAGGAITGQTCTSNGNSAVVNVSANYVRINMTALTITAGSSVTVTWDGWVNNPSGGGGTIGGSIAATQIAFGAAAANTIAGSSNFTWNNASNTFTQKGGVSTPSTSYTQFLYDGVANENLAYFEVKSLTQPTAYFGSPQTDFPPLANIILGLGPQAVISSDSGPSMQLPALQGTAQDANGVVGQCGIITNIASGCVGVLGSAASATSSLVTAPVVGVLGVALDNGSTGSNSILAGVEGRLDCTNCSKQPVAIAIDLWAPSHVSESSSQIAESDGVEVEDTCVTGEDSTHPVACYGIHVQAQSNSGKAIVVDSGGGESDFQNTSIVKCLAGCILTASLTTTAATSDNVTVTGMLSSGHCTLTPTNASADTLLTGTYISAKTTDQITVTHAATSGATFDILCAPY